MGKYTGYMLCSDIDGTLTYDGRISEENREAIKRFEDEGGMFVISTGRQPYFVGKELDFIVNSPIICVNGTLIYDVKNEKAIFKRPFDNEIRDISYDAYLRFDEYLSLATVGYEGVQPAAHNKDEMKELLYANRDVFKTVYVLKSEEKALEFLKYVRDNYSTKVKVDRSWNVGCEIHSITSGKSECISELRKLYPHIHTVIAVGDYENDLEMIRDADIGCAVENAIPCVKDVANRIVPSNKDHAIAYIIDNI